MTNFQRWVLAWTFIASGLAGVLTLGRWYPVWPLAWAKRCGGQWATAARGE